MANAGHDQNHVPTLTALSSVDGVTVVPVYVDPVTHRLLVDSGGGGGITIGTTTITSGTTGRVLYDNAGVVGEMTTTGSGTVLALATSPALVTPSLGVATATTINRVTLTAPATGSTLTIIDGKTLTINKTISFTAADDTGVYTLPTGTATLVATTVTSLSSLVTVGTLTGGATGAGFTVALGTSTITGILGSANGGTGNGFTKFSGPVTAEKTFTLPNASATILTDNALVTLAQGGTATNLTASNGGIVYSTASALAILAGTATARKVLLSQSSTAPIWSTETYATPGTSGNVMTSDGANWTSAAPAGGTVLSSTISTDFEATTRFTTGNSAGGGSTTFDSSGCSLQTSGTAGGRALCLWIPYPGNSNLMTGSPSFTITLVSQANNNASAQGAAYFGLGQPTIAAGGITFTPQHIGFKILKVNGVETLYATQANGSTETASSALTTLGNGTNDTLELKLVKNSTTSVDYYWQKNGGGWSAATNLATNLGSGDNTILLATTNSNSSFANQYYVGGMAFTR